jgi:hypothetical protein
MVTMSLLFSRTRLRAELRESRGSAIFLNLRDDVRFPFRASARDGWTESNRIRRPALGRADASRLQPRVARPGSSAFAQLRRDKPTRLRRAIADHFSPTFGRRGDLRRGRLITNDPGIRD